MKNKADKGKKIKRRKINEIKGIRKRGKCKEKEDNVEELRYIMDIK